METLITYLVTATPLSVLCKGCKVLAIVKYFCGGAGQTKEQIKSNGPGTCPCRRKTGA
ncbi:MAG TPA: hypothetical protein VK436_06345 [Methanocella sp.]|nr:hypothetical protein [Methanocella sp.]